METSTNWILTLIDHITAPMRSITAATHQSAEAIDDVQERVRLSEKSTISALQNEKQHRDTLTAKIKEQEKNLKELEGQQKKATGLEWQKIEYNIEKATESLKDYRNALKLSDEDIKQLSDDVEHFKQKAANWSNVATGANQFSQIIGNISDSLNFAEDIMNLQKDIRLMTGAAGSDLSDLTAKVHHLAVQWNESDAEILRSANATSKQMGIGFAEALDLINQGFERGANLNGDFLDQLKQYGPQLKAAGISASEAIAIMATAGKEGIFSDKAIDSIKEANKSLKEMGKPQVDALKGIGIEVKDLSGKTAFEAVQMISKSMQGATTQAKQLVLKEIFKEAGEDAGLGFVMGIGSVDMDLSKMPSVQAAGAGMKGFFADIQSFIADNAGGAAIWAQGFADVAFQINNVTGLVNTLRGSQAVMNVVTKAATASQWLFNAALWANPIGLVIGLIVALVGGIILLSKHFDWAAGIVEAFSNSWKDWGKVILDFILYPLKQVMGVLEGIWKLMQGDFSGAMKAVTDPTRELVADATTAIEKTQQGYNKGVADFGKEQVAGNRKEYNQEHGILGVDDNTKIDGQLSTKNTKGGKAKSSDNGMSISGGGGNKTTTMNLTINNYFKNISSKLDIQNVANEISGILNDRMRDSLISQS